MHLVKLLIIDNVPVLRCVPSQTYAGSVNRELIKDEALRRATELQIAHFGQVPLQLFKTPHPARRLQTQSTQLPRHVVHSLDTAELISGSAAAGSIARVADNCDEEFLSSQSLCSAACRRSKYLQKQSSLLNTSCGNVLALSIGTSKIMCVLDSGVLEFYR